jgi:hypothetical protein
MPASDDENVRACASSLSALLIGAPCLGPLLLLDLGPYC